MARGGWSWKRATGVTKAKQSLSRKTGVPLTKSGRQRKVGKAMSGCLTMALIALAAVAGLIVIMI